MLSGRMFTSQGVADWYPEILKPSFTPPGSVIGIVWTVIYILCAISLIMFVNRGRGRPLFWPIVALYVFNGVVNAAWSYIFFTRHLIGPAVIDAVLIALTAGLMMVLVWPWSRAASLLLLPYVLWVSFASYLTYAIYLLN